MATMPGKWNSKHTNLTLKFRYRMGPNGLEITYLNGKAMPDELVDYIKQNVVGEATNNKFITAKTEITANMAKSFFNFSGDIKKAVGDLFEGLVVLVWINCLQRDGYCKNEDISEVMNFLTKAKNVISQRSPRNAQHIFSSSEAAATASVERLFEIYRADIEKAAKGDVSITHEGGSSGIGDIILNIAGVKIVVECKNYAEESFESIHGGNFNYFSLVDSAERGNFKISFRDYLAKTKYFEGHQIWRIRADEGAHEMFMRWQDWTESVYEYGFKGFCKNLAENGKFFSYLLQKGERYSQGVDKRPFIALVRGQYNRGIAHLYVEADLKQLAETGTPITEEYGRAAVRFLREGQEVGYFHIDKQSMKDIKKIGMNARLETQRASSEPYEKKAWSTTFNFMINKNLFSTDLTNIK